MQSNEPENLLTERWVVGPLSQMPHDTADPFERTKEALLSIVAVEDTEDGARDIDSIETEELNLKVTVDGELTIDNGYTGGIFGLRDLIGDRSEDSVRLELRIVWQRPRHGHFSD